MTKAMAIATISSPMLLGTPSVAVSLEAEYIGQHAQEPWDSIQQLNSIGIADLFHDLGQLAIECERPGWDGDGADPVLPSTIDQAVRLLRALPPGMSRPTLGVEPDGQITFEWYTSPKQVLSVSVCSDGNLYFAALLGAARHFGREPFFGDMPDEILRLVHRVAA